MLLSVLMNFDLLSIIICSRREVISLSSFMESSCCFSWLSSDWRLANVTGGGTSSERVFPGWRSSPPTD
jgi:hypothetical protein